MLRELIRDVTAPDNHRYKAATLLLMADLTGSPETLAVLHHMTGDQSLSEPTRSWAAFAADYAKNRIHVPDGAPPASGLRS